MAIPKCNKIKCFANFCGLCTCLNKSYVDKCPFFKTRKQEYEEIKDDNVGTLQEAFTPQVLKNILREGERNE